ncbi:MAG: hypothetical protein JWR01_1272 [Subtercola sp.]|nr:hypothetical protein [Subtercola sp.]
MVTSRDVARAARVSQATVSRVLSGGVVSADTRSRVLLAIAETGYTPNTAARTMRTGLTHTVGIVVADLENPFYPAMLDALTAAFARAGYRTVVWVASSTANTAALDAIRQRGVDGVVFTTVTEDSPELHGALEGGSPVVLVNRALPGVDCDQVSSDNVAGANLVADYFVSHGRTRIAFVGGTPRATTSQRRLAGFAERLAELGHPLDPRLVIEGEYTYASGRNSVERLLGAGLPVDAVFCSNDLLAFGAMDGARGLGVRVPEDVWLVGYDDIAMSDWGAYSLTTVRQDIVETAELACRLLVSRVEGGPRESVTRRFAPTLVVRGSTGFTA